MIFEICFAKYILRLLMKKHDSICVCRRHIDDLLSV